MKPISSLMMVIVFVVSLLGGNPQPVQSAPPPPDAIQTLQSLSGGQAVIDRNPETGLVRFIGTDQDHAVALQSSPSASRTSADAAMQFARDYGALFGVSSPDADLQVEKAETSADGQTFVRYQQTYQGIPVLGAEIIVQLDGAQRLLSMSGEALDGIQVVTTPAVDAQTAQQTALEMTAKEYGMPIERLLASEPALWVYNPRLLGDPSIPLTGLVWRTEVTAIGLEPLRELVLVDAQRGGVRLHFNQVDAVLNRTIYDNNNDFTIGLPGSSVVRSEGGAASGVADVDYAYDFAGQTYDYYFSNFGRDSIDNAGMELISTVRYCSPSAACPYANAFWNGVQMVYGAGFADADDVVGHELTHGVTERTAGLFYYMQSGAINESLSDIFGEFVDQLNNTRGTDAPATKWRMGEDLAGYSTGIRDMKDPTSKGDPDKITSVYYVGGRWGGGANDYGGVHSNSGILNKAAYLLVDGDTFNGQTVIGLGLDKTAQIFYKMQTSLLVSGSDYNDIFNLLPQACNSLAGTHGIISADCAQVVNAVTATEMDLINTFNGPDKVTSACPAGYTKSSLFSEGFEGTLANWTLTGGAWGFPPADYNYAKSGLHELAADDAAIVSADSSAAMNAGVTLPSDPGMATYLHFAHAFDLDSFGSGPGGTYYDGGVVEYSENGTNWFAMDALPVVNGPSATLETGFGNPLEGRTAFSGVSHGYQTTRYDLATLAGKNVRFRWRLGVDSSGSVLAWFLDDVNVYSCPQVSISNLSPSSAQVGDPAFTLLINGSGFQPTSTVRWNGSNRITTYISSTQLSTLIPATDLLSAGSVLVTVFNSSPGGGASNELTFTINNPVPVLTDISPTQGTAGSVTLTLTLNGSNFISSSKVRWNGSDRTTTFVSTNQLSASIPAADLVNVGTATVTVFNPAPGGGLSSDLPFTITPTNPLPLLTQLSLTTISAGSGDTDLTVTGTNFILSSIGRWNGSDLSTTFVDSTHLIVTLPASLLTIPSSANITVFNPPPGGGLSSGLPFTVSGVGNNPYRLYLPITIR